MKSMSSIVFAILLLSLRSSGQESTDSLRLSLERHLRNIRQLTFGGENAEAYFSNDEQRLIFQSTRGSLSCDQIFTMNLQGEDVRMLSTGKGKTTCSFFLPGDSTFIFSSTHHRDTTCPPRPDYSRGYVWPVLPDYDIFLASFRTGIMRQLTDTPGYDAEATVSPRGDRIVFTSMRNGDLDLYSMTLDGKDVRQLTSELGYDGGAFFSPDGKQIVYRAFHPSTDREIQDYRDFLRENLVRPLVMEIQIMNNDGTNKRQLTHAGAASFAPFFLPSGNQIIFSSNMHDPKGRNFDLFLMNVDGSGLEQITFNDTFDGFPMFTRDGKHLVFASNRSNKVKGETNVFLAEWVP